MIKQNDTIKISTGTLTVIKKDLEKGRWVCLQETTNFNGQVVCLEKDLIRWKQSKKQL